MVDIVYYSQCECVPGYVCLTRIEYGKLNGLDLPDPQSLSCMRAAVMGVNDDDAQGFEETFSLSRARDSLGGDGGRVGQATLGGGRNLATSGEFLRPLRCRHVVSGSSRITYLRSTAVRMRSKGDYLWFLAALCLIVATVRLCGSSVTC